MITVTQHNDQYEIRFPYDQAVVEHVKNVPGREWHPDTKCWTIPLARLGFFIAQVKGTIYEQQVLIYSQEAININASIDESNKVPDIDVSEYTYKVQTGLKPYKHQIDSLKFAKWRYENGLKSGFVLADEPGGAKTCQVFNIGRYMRQFHGSKHCLIIVCVNSAKYNWKEDILKHSDEQEDPYILGTRLRRDKVTENTTTGSEEKLKDLVTMCKYGKENGQPLPYFLIMNVEAIRMKRGKVYPIADRLVQLMQAGDIGVVALDEVHRNCFDYNTLIRTDQGLMKIGKIVENKLNLNVLSYDIVSDELTYQPISDWHTYVNTSPLIELVIEEGTHCRLIRCTPDHEFYTKNRGWVTACNLEETDDIVFNKEITYDNQDMPSV